jgi:adenylate cyclase
MPEITQRRLAAIVSTDVVGYSRLMGADEAGTLARMKGYRRDLWNPLIEKHGGRVVGTAGDSLLIEFSSAVAAVQSSIEVQEGMAAGEAASPDDKKMLLRVGINIGEVVVDGDDIYGDGVNVAARLQTLAPPGGICISGKVHDEIEGKLTADFADAGPQQVKNIERPIQVWQWPASEVASGAETKPANAAASPPPVKPSIAVLPFDNMSGDPEQEFFSDGMSEDLITGLSKIPWFYVVARNSTFVYKNRAVDVKTVARDLGVRYVLEGSVRKAGNRLRITAQLIDAATNNHVWAERFDREIEDIFAIQDEVVEAIVGAVAPEFLTFEAKRAQRKDPHQLDAWECMIRGRALVEKLGREEVAQARQLFERALQLVPDGSFGAADLAMVHWLEYYYRWSEDPDRSLREMVACAEKAVEADGDDPWSLTMLGLARGIAAGRWDDVLSPIERALTRNPNFAPAVALKGFVLALRGDVEEAVDHMLEAKRLSPHDPFMGFWLMGLYWAYYMLGDYAAATDAALRGIRLAPQNPTYRRQLAASLAMEGKLDEAKASIATYLELEPNHTMADAAKVPTRRPEHRERFLEGLRLAGLPE